MTVARGEIYVVDLAPTRGREQRGRRPVLVVSSDAINRQPLVVTVVVGTKGKNVPRDYPTNVRVSAAESGLSEETVFLGFQIRSLDASRFEDASRKAAPAGALPPDKMALVDEALRLVLAL